jgi:RimJ/RimL family protein N-acetyltransferase
MLEAHLNNPNTRSFAVVDKNNLTKAKEFDSPLVALITFEKHFGYRNGYVAVASARRAWGEKLCQPGLVQQASQLVIDQLFESEPTLNRLSLTTLAANTAAKNLALRLGFRKDGYFVNLAQSKGVGASVIHMGLQRPMAA